LISLCGLAGRALGLLRPAISNGVRLAEVLRRALWGQRQDILPEITPAAGWGFLLLVKRSVSSLKL